MLGKRISLFIVSAIVCMLGLELAVKYIFYTSEERSSGVGALYKGDKNIFLNDFILSDQKECYFPQITSFHPHFAWVIKNTSSWCYPQPANQYGVLEGRNFPYQNEDKYFDILVVGGSVANHLSWPLGNPSFLEQALSKYRDSKGRKIRVFGGTGGGWNYPIQQHLTMLLSGSVDAVVAVDGYNENLIAQSVPPVFSVTGSATVFAVANLIGFSDYQAFYDFKKIKNFVMNNPVFSRSFFIHHLITKIVYFRLSMIPDVISHNHIWNLEQDRILNAKKPLLLDHNSKSQQVSRLTKTYLDYIEDMRLTAKAHKAKFFHFLQPTRAMGKTLTEEEKSYRWMINKSLYTSMDKSIRDLEKKHYPTMSLSQIFKDEKRTVYKDHIHCSFDYSQFSGYTIMADTIAKRLALDWNFTKSTKDSNIPIGFIDEKLDNFSTDLKEKYSKEIISNRDSIWSDRLIASGSRAYFVDLSHLKDSYSGTVNLNHNSLTEKTKKILFIGNQTLLLDPDELSPTITSAIESIYKKIKSGLR